MTPVPFELPLRASEAASIADLLFQQIEGKPLSDDQRGRFAGRVSALETPTITIYPGSLAADPFHPSTYYLAVDGTNHGVTSQLLLRIGLSSAPGTALFPKSLMIGRMRPNGQREVVVSAIPFGPEDEEHIRTFASSVDKSFLPRPHGAQAAVTVRSAHPAGELPAAFEGFRQLPRSTAAAVEVPAASFWTAVWAAIRAGRREAYSVGTVIDMQAGREAALRQVEQTALFTKYVIAAAGAAPLDDVLAVMDQVRRAKAGISSAYTRTADFELALGPSAAELATVLAELRAAGRAVQFVASGGDEALEPWVEAARHAGALLTLDVTPESPLAAIGVATGARVNLRLTAAPELDLRTAVHELASGLR